MESYGRRSADNSNVLSLRALLPLGDLELYNLPLLKIPEPLARDPRVVNEDILAFLRSDEPIPLLPVKPLDSTLWHTSSPGAGCPHYRVLLYHALLLNPPKRLGGAAKLNAEPPPTPREREGAVDAQGAGPEGVAGVRSARPRL